MRTLITVSLLLVFAAANAASHVDTLQRISETGEIRIGFVPDAPPLSFLDGDGNAVGYSIDLCRHITSRVRKDTRARTDQRDVLRVIAVEASEPCSVERCLIYWQKSACRRTCRHKYRPTRGRADPRSAVRRDGALLSPHTRGGRPSGRTES